jgi:hypothetical protein
MLINIIYLVSLCVVTMPLYSLVATLQGEAERLQTETGMPAKQRDMFFAVHQVGSPAGHGYWPWWVSCMCLH